MSAVIGRIDIARSFLFRRQELKNNSCIRPLQPNKWTFSRKHKQQRKVSFYYFTNILASLLNFSRFLKSHIPEKTSGSHRIYSIAEMLVMHSVHWIATVLFQFPLNMPLYQMCLKVSFSRAISTFLPWISIFIANSLFLVIILIKMIASTMNQGYYHYYRHSSNQALKVHIVWITGPCVLHANRLPATLWCLYACLHTCMTFPTHLSLFTSLELDLISLFNLNT